jgi:transcriptional regulator with XRE-family HTH domain
MNTRLNVPRLREEMIIRGLTGQELATLSGVSAATISHAMRGRAVSVRTVNRLAKALSRLEPLTQSRDLLEVRPLDLRPTETHLQPG